MGTVLKKTQMGGRRALRDPSDIGRIGVIGHERELLLLKKLPMCSLDKLAIKIFQLQLALLVKVHCH